MEAIMICECTFTVYFSYRQIFFNKCLYGFYVLVFGISFIHVLSDVSFINKFIKILNTWVVELA